ncbi:MAG: hypothetical protein F4X63_09250 [Nitrospira sp. SB0662_bin_26]|nr:hypothetical protein [Nitrospira sp. SB0662_bin_26]
MARPRGRPRHARVYLEGYEKAWAKAKNFEELIPLLVGASLHSEGKRMMALSKTKVPVATGALQASAYVNKPERYGPVYEVELGYGGTTGVPYATYIHEMPRSGKTHGLDRKGKAYPPGSWSNVGQWKYLEEAANTLAPTAAGRIGAEVRANLAVLGADMKLKAGKHYWKGGYRQVSKPQGLDGMF